MMPPDRQASPRSSPVRVVLVGPSLDILGGQAVILQRLLSRLRETGGVTAEFLPVNPRLPGPLAGLQRVKYVRTVTTSIAYVWSLFRRLRNYDVIHVFSASYTSFVLAPTPALLIARLFRRPSILNYRSGEAQDHFRRWRTAAPTARLAERIIVPSGYLVDVFEEFDLPAAAIANSVDLDNYTYRLRESCGPQFLANRNFAPLYNVGCALRAFRVVQDAYPEAHLVVAGDGEERDALHELARKLELNVDFLGQVPPLRMTELYNQADVYLNSSSIDNMPNSIVEAFASGLPVVTTDAGGIPYMVEHERTGMLAPVDDHAALGAAALRVLREPALARALSFEGRRRCEAEYSWTTVIDQWVSAYRELAQSS